MLTVVGIDFSLTGLGLCAIPGGWDPTYPDHWKLVTLATLTTPAGVPIYERADALACDVVRWLRGLGVPPERLRLCHEGYPLGPGKKAVFNLDKLIELGGIVKRAIWLDLRLDVWPSPQSTSRKLVCGRLPQKDRKKAAIAAIQGKAFGELDDATPDECDAVVAANLYCKELGLRHVWTPEPPKVKRPSKRRSRTQVGQLVIGELSTSTPAPYVIPSGATLVGSPRVEGPAE
jgi:hypothetical protein